MADDNRTPQNGGSDKEPSGNNWMKSLLIWAGIILALVMPNPEFTSATAIR